ncbi:MAG TPA: non-canonical purine NTP pyrophosphatase, partial [Gemmatimonadales bacterium]|nr:non-canonical purine NTP pyrophosphatase [Gemmatimonadales bacterium]
MSERREVRKRLLVATRNRHKVAELSDMLGAAGLPEVEVLALEDAARVLGRALPPDTVEDAPDFQGNAAKKAREAAAWAGLPALADDSGLEVDALGGAPGVRSARFAGEPCDDARNNALLLERLAAVPDDARRARFVAVVALARPDRAAIEHARGTCEGHIARHPR